MEAGSFPLRDYLRRIGLTGRPGLAELHRAHVDAIPFENLDPQRGVPVSLEPSALVDKLVTARRGGYCFEQNLLFALALEALGARVELMLGRVRLGRAPGQVGPRTHLALRVEADGRKWLADVGFGNGTLLEPIPFGPGGVHEQSGWRFRIVADGREHVLQTEAPAGWTDLYAFVPEAVPRIDLETSNWYTATHPSSSFVTGFIVAAHRPDGTILVLSDWDELSLSQRTPGGATETPVRREDVPDLLESHFGLPGFALGEDGRIVRAS